MLKQIHFGNIIIFMVRGYGRKGWIQLDCKQTAVYVQNDMTIKIQYLNVYGCWIISF